MAHFGPRSSCAAHASIRRPRNTSFATRVAHSGLLFGPRSSHRCPVFRAPFCGLCSMPALQLDVAPAKKKNQKESLTEYVGIGSQCLSLGLVPNPRVDVRYTHIQACSVPSHAYATHIRLAPHQKTDAQELLRNPASAIPGLLAHYTWGWAGLRIA